MPDVIDAVTGKPLEPPKDDAKAGTPNPDPVKPPPGNQAPSGPGAQPPAKPAADPHAVAPMSMPQPGAPGGTPGAWPTGKVG